MEIVQNRYGVDRVIEKIGDTKIRVMGESFFSRGATDDNGIQTMFGGKIKFMGSDFKIKSIKPEDTKQENLASVIVEVEL